jgi:hypothetical protein
MSADEPQDIHNNADELLDELLPDHARDLLITRVIDGRASADDWDRFRKLAANEPGIWVELADTQNQHEIVRDELRHAIACADRVDLPGGVIDETFTRQRMSLTSKWGGWAIAAALLIAWSLGLPSLQTTGSDPTQPETAGLPGSGLISGIGLQEAEPEQAFERYLSAGQQSGKVIAEMPEQVVVETTPMPDGTIEVIYLRQIIERRVVEQAYQQVRDETGNTIAVPVKLRSRSLGAF